MLNAQQIFALGNSSVVAPAGYGKTQLIAEVTALGRRTLILTHTHAGVHAIRERLKKLSVPSARFSVDTVAGWSMRYANSFPKTALPPEDMPVTSAEWNQLYIGARSALSVGAVREIVEASYDKILIDEYQDCSILQHELAISLSEIVPTTIFGDPMQGIFEFAGATLSWDDDIFEHFPLATELRIPHRWSTTNPDLGSWLAEVREKLIQGNPIDLDDPRVNFRLAENAFDMAVMFDGIDDRVGSFAAIHCNKGVCYQLANAARGGYQAIEEVAANRLHQFADEWDRSTSGHERRDCISTLLTDSFNKRPLVEGEVETPQELVLLDKMREVSRAFDESDGLQAAKELLSLCRNHPRWRLYRSGLWRDVERSVQEVISGRHTTMSEAAGEIRQRVSHSGRKLPSRTVSTPLLLKGLEFDHVVVPHAAHYVNERSAQAKLFYVAISRGSRNLTISAPSRYIQFPRPRI